MEQLEKDEQNYKERQQNISNNEIRSIKRLEEGPALNKGQERIEKNS